MEDKYILALAKYVEIYGTSLNAPDGLLLCETCDNLIYDNTYNICVACSEKKIVELASAEVEKYRVKNLSEICEKIISTSYYPADKQYNYLQYYREEEWVRCVCNSQFCLQVLCSKQIHTMYASCTGETKKKICPIQLE